MLRLSVRVSLLSVRGLITPFPRPPHDIVELCYAAEGLQQHEIARVCARHDLESDEFYTDEQKALRIINH